MEELKCEVLPENCDNYGLSFKIIVVGDPGVGKSCLTMKATKEYFEDLYSPTVGFEFFTFNIKINDECIKLQIWDTCGQENYKSLILNFYRNSSLIILIYSIDNKLSFQNVENWNNEIVNNCRNDTKKILVGNKIDLENEREISFNDGLEYAKKNNFDYFFESSIINGINVDNIFIKSSILLFDDYINNHYDDISYYSGISDYTNSVILKKIKNDKSFFKCC
jgi:small GTP-binding protein